MATCTEMVKIVRGVPEISCRTDRQADRQTYSSQYFATALAGEVIKFSVASARRVIQAGRECDTVRPMTRDDGCQ